MQECGGFSIRFETQKEAETVAETIRDWAERELEEHDWINQLFPVNSNVLFVGDNAVMDWYEYNDKISKLAEIIHEAHPGIVFNGTQGFCNLTTGFKVSDKFSCDGNTVSITPNITCANCGASIEGTEYQVEDKYFCDEDCVKAFLIECLPWEGDTEKQELMNKDWGELADMYCDL